MSFPLLLVMLGKPQELKSCEDRTRVAFERSGITLQVGTGDVIMGLFVANALWFHVVPMSKFGKRKWLPGAAFQAPPKHSSSIPPTEPSEAGAGREWRYDCQLRLRDATKSDGLKRFWAMTRVQNQSGKPH